MNVFEDPDEELEHDLIAATGFAVPHVTRLLVRESTGEREVAITSPLGAFVVLHVGSGGFSVTAIGRSAPVGRTWEFSFDEDIVTPRSRSAKWRPRPRRPIRGRRRWGLTDPKDS